MLTGYSLGALSAWARDLAAEARLLVGLADVALPGAGPDGASATLRSAAHTIDAVAVDLESARQRETSGRGP
jgi:hypothetical protein